MAYAFKQIREADRSLLKSAAYASQQIDSGSSGVYTIQYRSGSKTDQYQNISQSVSKSYWHSVDTLYYKSSSLRLIENETLDFFNNIIREDIQGKTQHLNKFNISKNDLFIEMLYGIRRDLSFSLKKQGYCVRLYVPFGTEWLPYTLRRLREYKNLKFIIFNIIKELMSGKAGGY